jgi:hypothetical protein
MNMINFDALWECVAKQYHGRIVYSVHGPSHWRRVEKNGLLLATRTGADPVVVRLFALFHDSCRMNDGSDDGHGGRRSGPILDTIVRLALAEQWDVTLEQILRDADVISEDRQMKSRVGPLKH